MLLRKRNKNPKWYYVKKSDDIQLIAKRLNPIGVSDDTCEEVIDILIKAGMLPPRTKLEPLNAYDNAWDREDETI